MTINVLQIHCREVTIEDAIWYTVSSKGGTTKQRNTWFLDADTWATSHLDQGFIGVRPRGLEWQKDCRWLVHEGSFWFRDPEDMFIFYLAVTP